MRVVLHNFKSFKEITLSFEEGESNLLSGDSGSGKTTILEAIRWCLYSGSGRSVYPYGVSSKSSDPTFVELHFNNFPIRKITRKMPPSEIKVFLDNGENYSSNEAENFIFRYFGKSELFFCTSYIPQNERNSIIALNNSGKMEMIEKLVFGESILPDEYISIIDEKIRKKSKNITLLANEKEILERVIESLSQTLSEITEEVDISEKEALFNRRELLISQKEKFISLQSEKETLLLHFSEEVLLPYKKEETFLKKSEIDEFINKIKSLTKEEGENLSLISEKEYLLSLLSKVESVNTLFLPLFEKKLLLLKKREEKRNLKQIITQFFSFEEIKNEELLSEKNLLLKKEELEFTIVNYTKFLPKFLNFSINDYPSVKEFYSLLLTNEFSFNSETQNESFAVHTTQQEESETLLNERLLSLVQQKMHIIEVKKFHSLLNEKESEREREELFFDEEKCKDLIEEYYQNEKEQERVSLFNEEMGGILSVKKKINSVFLFFEEEKRKIGLNKKISELLLSKNLIDKVEVLECPKCKTSLIHDAGILKQCEDIALPSSILKILREYSLLLKKESTLSLNGCFSNSFKKESISFEEMKRITFLLKSIPREYVTKVKLLPLESEILSEIKNIEIRIKRCKFLHLSQKFKYSTEEIALLLSFEKTFSEEKAKWSLLSSNYGSEVKENFLLPLEFYEKSKNEINGKIVNFKKLLLYRKCKKDTSFLKEECKSFSPQNELPFSIEEGEEKIKKIKLKLELESKLKKFDNYDFKPKGWHASEVAKITKILTLNHENLRLNPHRKRISQINNFLNTEFLDFSLEDTTKESEKIRKNLENIEIVEKNLPKLKMIEENKKKMSVLLTNIKKLEEKVLILHDLKKEIILQRSGLITSFVNELNFLVNTILPELFDDDISFCINLIKENKKESKPSINFTINWRNLSFDGIGYLSGGERDRLSLALTLAVSEMVCSPILIFDESLSSLDEDMRELCVKTIKKYSKGKSVINVCHSLVEGLHSNIVSLKR